VEILIEQVTGDEDERAMLEVRGEVFGREMGIRLGPEGAREGGKISHLLARAYPGREAVGTLSVVDTSGDRRLHESHNLGFGPGARAARFMHLAVLRPFRGRNIPSMMMLEAHRRFVAPLGYDFTWLLFDAERAPASFLSRLLGFTPRPDVFVSDYGRRCPLVRDERAEEAVRAIRRAEQLLRPSASLYSLAPSNVARFASSA
jgi:ribosomal protein S18 acetylase RimI-like enzyme